MLIRRHFIVRDFHHICGFRTQPNWKILITFSTLCGQSGCEISFISPRSQITRKNRQNASMIFPDGLVQEKLLLILTSLSFLVEPKNSRINFLKKVIEPKSKILNGAAFIGYWIFQIMRSILHSLVVWFS